MSLHLPGLTRRGDTTPPHAPPPLVPPTQHYQMRQGTRDEDGRGWEMAERHRSLDPLGKRDAIVTTAAGAGPSRY